VAESQVDRSQPVIVGRIIGTHGVLGGVKVDVMSDVPHRFDVGQAIFIRGKSYPITSSTRTPNSQVILKFQGVDSSVSARDLVGESMTVSQVSVPPLPEGEYYHFQLVGMRVLTEDGEYLGQVREILETGSNDVYVVSGESGEVLIPALADVIREVQVTKGVMVVRLLEGLR
jgi:16S rRNA processing protein RimM